MIRFWVIFFVLGAGLWPPLVAEAQDLVQIIERVEVIALQSLVVRQGERTFLDLTTAIANTNPYDLKLRSRRLEFFLGSLTYDLVDGERRESGVRLGADTTRDEITLDAEQRIAGTTLEGINTVTFHVDLGVEPNHVATLLSHIVNVLGNPATKAPLITVSGNAELGIPSASAGGADNRVTWNFVPGRIAWELAPRIQPSFLLYYGSSE